MDILLKSERKVSNLLESWGTDFDITPLEALLTMKDKALFVKYLDGLDKSTRKLIIT